MQRGVLLQRMFQYYSPHPHALLILQDEKNILEQDASFRIFSRASKRFPNLCVWTTSETNKRVSDETDDNDNLQNTCTGVSLSVQLCIALKLEVLPRIT